MGRDYQNVSLSKETLYKAIFPSKRYNVHTINTLITGLTGMAKKFTAISSLTDDENRISIEHLKWSRERNLIKYSNQKVQQMINKFSNTPLNDDDYLSLFELHDLLALGLGDDKEKNKRMLMNYSKTASAVESFCTIKIMKAMTEARMMNSSIGEDLSWLEERYKFLANEDLLPDDPKIKLLFYLYSLFTGYDQRSEGYYAKIIKLENEFDKYLSFDDKVFVYWQMEQYCLNYDVFNLTGKYSNEKWRCTKEMLGAMVHTKDVISDIGYRNCIRRAVARKEFDFALYIMDSLYDRIDAHKEDTYNYCRAYYHLYAKEFELSFQYLNKLHHSFFRSQFIVKELLAMLYFETGKFDEIYYIIDSYKHLYKHNRKLKYADVETKLFIDCIKSLTVFRTEKSPKALEEIQFLLGKEFTPYKNWFEDRLAEMQRNKY